MKKISVGDVVSCYNVYTGRKTNRKVIAVSPQRTKITLERNDWATGKMVFFWRPVSEWYVSDYGGEVFGYW